MTDHDAYDVAEDDTVPAARPEECPQCGSESFEYVPNHDDGISEGPAWMCANPNCKWGEWIP